MSQALHRRERESPAAILRGVGFNTPRQPDEVEHFLSDSSLVPVENLTIPTDIQPNTETTVSITIGNEAAFISPFEPDVCTRNFFNGYSLQVTFFVDGSELATEQLCVNTVASRTWTFNFVSGATGSSHEVELVVEGASTGEVLHEIERSVAVREDAPEPSDCSRDSECPQGQVCRDGQCVPEGGNGGGGGIIRDAQIILALVALTVLLLALP